MVLSMVPSAYNCLAMSVIVRTAAAFAINAEIKPSLALLKGQITTA